MIVVADLMVLVALLAYSSDTKKDYPIKSVPFTQVKVRDDFWSRRLETNRTVTIPHNFRQCELTGRIDNFAIAAGLKKGKFKGIHFNDSDVYKILEAAAFSLAVAPDPKLDGYVDSIITIIAGAQEKDGYLYTARKLMDSTYSPPGGKDRWVGEKDGSHELYNVGHLYEAAVAHFLATGKKNLLTIALKSADLVCATFGPSGRHEVPGHQVIEMGLSKLYRITGNEKYLNTAKFFLDQRGNAKGHALMDEYAQDHMPVREQKTAVGHSVRAAYMYSGMVDVAALTGDDSYMKALDDIWNDIVATKLYITGGLGASGGNEGFSSGYALPNLTAYCETCAAIANALWNYRMFLYYGDGKYIDIIERAVYNNFLSGVSMSGDHFFYPNPLEVFSGGAKRSEWFECACCPTNDARFMLSIPGFAYAHQGNDLFVNLFVAGEANISVDKQMVRLRQETRYPWDGSVQLTVDPEKQGEFSVKVRIPGWAQNRPVPSDLYRYTDKIELQAQVRVNGRPFSYSLEKNYAAINRTWKKGDVIEIVFPMEVRRIEAHPLLLDDKGRVALERGPIVYCLEGIDNKDSHAVNLVIPANEKLTSEYRSDLLNGVQVVRGTALPTKRTLENKIIVGDAQEFLAIPYYAWAHRGPSEMTVWPASDAQYARALPAPTIANTSKVSASKKRNADAVNDQLEPKNSIDHTIPFLHWWPEKGTTEWVEFDFVKEETVSKSDVYWFDDTGIGECRLPKSWRILYKEGDQWKPVENLSADSVAKDCYNQLTFKPVKTQTLRLEIQLISDFSAGVYEWRVE